MSLKNDDFTRRKFLSESAKAAAGIVAGSAMAYNAAGAAPQTKPGSKMKFGLVTYLWGQDWDLPSLIRNCEYSGCKGVELRVEHAHGVHAGMNEKQRFEVKLRFKNSGIVNVGMGCNWAFHYPEPERLKKEIEGAKADIKLSFDTGGIGIKVKPNALPKGVPPEKTLEQIGKSLNVIGNYAQEFDQVIRVEVHGRDTQQLPNMKKIFDFVTEKNVGMCWNCNSQDLDGKGLEYNFKENPDYPYQKLINMFVAIDYEGWILLEARGNVPNRIDAIAEQGKLFKEMVQKAQAQI
jgi:sugar phosphate isomerase/epimerase